MGFGLVNAADANAARTRFAAPMGEPTTAFSGWGAVDVTSLSQPVAIQGLPVGARNQTVWPNIDRGGSYLRG